MTVKYWNRKRSPTEDSFHIFIYLEIYIISHRPFLCSGLIDIKET